MSANSNAQRLVVVPDAEDFSSESRTSSIVAEPEVCSSCFGTGMEVVAGKGARRCRCRAREAQAKLLEAASVLPVYYFSMLIMNAIDEAREEALTDVAELIKPDAKLS
jgi:hypothetical protein